MRRVATIAVNEQATTVQAAQKELEAVRKRLAIQRARLVQDLGVPESALVPQPAEQALATQAVAGGPGTVLAALRQARGTADAADAAMLGPGPQSSWRPWARNLLVYGPSRPPCCSCRSCSTWSPRPARCRRTPCSAA